MFRDFEIPTGDIEQTVKEAEVIFQRRKITQDEKDLIWNAIAGVCYLHLQRKEGLFWKVCSGPGFMFWVALLT